MIALLVSFALAEPNSAADNVDSQWRAMQVLRVRPEAYRLVEEPITFGDGPLQVTLTEGVLIPIFSGFHEEDRDGIRQAKAEAFELGLAPPPPLEEGEVEFVGFVFTAADGQFELGWQERADNLIFANHQVTRLRGDRDDWRDVASGEPWTGKVTEGFVLSTDPALEKAFVGPSNPDTDPSEVVVYGNRNYTAAKLRARVLFQDRREAMKRAGWQASRGVAWDRIVDKFELEAHGKHTLIDVHIDQNLGDYEQPLQPPQIDWMTHLQDWTGLMDTRAHTTVAALDISHDDRLIYFPLTQVPFDPIDPDDPTSHRLAPARLEVGEAYVVVQGIPVTSQIRTEILARLKLTATGGDFQVAQLFIPRHGSELDFRLLSITDADGNSLISRDPQINLFPGGGGPVVRSQDGAVDGTGIAGAPQSVATGINSTPRSDAMSATTASDNALGGGPQSASNDLIGREGALRDQPAAFTEATSGNAQMDVNRTKPQSLVTLSLPQPIRKGESLIVDVKWKDVWPYGILQSGERSSPGGGTNNDMAGSQRGGIRVETVPAPASGPQNILPRPAGAPRDTATRFQIEVVVPARTELVPSVSGNLQSEWEDDQRYRHTLSAQLSHAVPWPQVHLGAFKPIDYDAAAGMPAVRTRTFNKSVAKQLAAESRAQINFYEGFLPKYPWDEFEVALGPAPSNTIWSASGHGLTGTGITTVSSVTAGGDLTRQSGSNTTQRLLAHELAHQWFGQSIRPAHLSDAWFAETFAEVFGVLYTTTLHGGYDRTYKLKVRKFQTLFVDPFTRVPLTQAYQHPLRDALLFDYGPYVFQEMLRPRIGNESYFGAIDVIARDFAGKPTTTEQIERWFSQAAERDLSDFFDFWVYGGFIPRSVVLDWEWSDGSVRAAVTSDVPFGTFEVPFSMDGQTHWVTVKDGWGQVEVDASAQPKNVELDPEHRIVAIRRVTRNRAPEVPEWVPSSPE